MEELFRGLVSVDFNDGDALQKMATLVEALKGEFAKVANMPVADIGRNLSGPLGQNVGEIEHQIRKVGELSRELQKLAELNSQPGRLRGEGGRFVAKDAGLAAQLEQINQIVSATDKARDKLREYAQVQADFDRANRGGFGAQSSAQDRMRQQEAALQQLVQAGGSEAEVRKFLGLPAVEPEAGAGKYFPRPAAELQRGVHAAFPDVESLEFDQLQTRVLRAGKAFDLAATGLEAEYKTAVAAEQAEIRYLSALQQLTAASESLAKAQTARGLKEQKELVEREARDRAQADPRVGQLSMSSEEFLQAQGLDLNQSAQKSKLEHELKQNALRTQELIAKGREVSSQEEVAKLTEAKKALAIKEIQLKSQLVDLEQREARAARGDGGFVGGVFGKNQDDGGFGEGFGYQAGITFKFFAFYSLFAALQQGALAAKEAYQQYTEAVTDLSVALQVNYDEADQLATKYQEVGAAFGQGPIATTEAMAKFARTYGYQEGNDQDSVLNIGARVGGILNMLEPKGHVDDVMADLIGLANAYGIGPGGAEGLLDQTTFVARKYGFKTAGEVLPGTAAIADIGKESGYTPADLAALVASVMRSTGVGSDAAAGDLKRFLGSQNDPGLVQLFDRMGIDQDLTLKEKIDELAVALQGKSEEEQARELTSASNPRIAAAVTAAFRGAIEANTISGQAETDAVGAASELAEKQLKAFAGRLKEFGAEIQQLLVALASSGIADVLGVAFEGLIATVDVLGKVVSLFNSMPDALRQIIGLVTVLLAMNKANAILTGGEGFLGKGSRFGLDGNPMFNRNGAALKSAQEGLSLAMAGGDKAAIDAAKAKLAATTAATTGTVGLTGRLTTLGASLRAAAVGVAGLVASMIPMLAVTGGVWVVSEASSSADRQTSAANELLAGSKDLAVGQAAKDPDKIKAAEDRIARANNELRKGDDGFANWLMNTLTPGLEAARNGVIGKGAVLIARAEAEVDAILAAEARLDAKAPTSEWFGKNYNNITRGVSLIQQKGIDGSRVTEIIDDLLRQTPGVVQSALQPGEGQTGIPELQKYAMERIGGGGNPMDAQAQYADLSRVLSAARTRMAQDPNADLSQLESMRRLLDEVNKQWASSIVSLTKARVDMLKGQYTGAGTQAQIEAELTKALTAALETGDIEAIAQLIGMVDKAFLKNFLANLKAQREILQAQEAAIMAALDSTADKAYGALEGNEGGNFVNDSLGRLKDVQRRIQGIRGQEDAINEALGIASPGGTATRAAQDELAIAKAMAGATPGDPVSQAEAQLAAANVRLKGATKDTAQYYDALREVAEAKRSLAEAESAQAQAELLAGAEVGNPLSAAKASVKAAQSQLDLEVEGTAGYYNAKRAVAEAKYNLARTELQVALAERAASEIPGDPMSAALTNIDAARRTIAFTKDPNEYWAAMKQLKQAQYELAQLELQNTANRDLLRIDITDPVAQAEARVREAQRTLSFDQRRGVSEAVLLQDRVTLRQARSEAEGTAWSQEFNDQRTNYELQRTSLSAYLKYLRSQHDYLSAVKDKTRQQVDQLNAVDQALKGLTDGLQGQWNLGDIRVPTPYEMRRSLAAGGPTQVSYVTISLTSASGEDFVGILERYVGSNVMQTAGTAPAKVL